MSYVTQPAGAPQRPGTVTMSTMLLYLAGALYLISGVLSVISLSSVSKETITEIYRDAGMDKAAADAAGSFFSVAAYGSLAFTVVISALIIVLAVFVGKGKQWARITTWVVGGILACCAGVGLVGQGVQGAMGGSTGGVNQAELQKKLEEAMPSWQGPVTLALGAIQLIVLLAVLILLALPPSHPYFRKVEPTWVPPTYPQA